MLAAIEPLQEALSIAIELGNLALEGVFTCTLALATLRAGEIEDAQTLLARALAISGETRDKETTSECLVGLAAAALTNGDQVRAQSLWGDANTLREGLDEPRFYAKWCHELVASALGLTDENAGSRR